MKAVKALLLTLLFSISGCSPRYVLRAAFEEGSILWKRRPIEEVLKENDLDPKLVKQLNLVASTRLFALSEGLDPGGSFKSYSHIEEDVLSWLVVASRDESFELYTWWFPFVGSVPYKGFFEKDEAIAEAQKLQSKGYETSIRPVEAFSTLGWFDDPVLTPLLKHHPVEVANTVLHESVHSTVWIKGQVPFNESLAHFVGLTEAVKYFERNGDEENIKHARAMRAREFETGAIVTALHSELAALYASNSSREEKLLRKSEIFERWVRPFREKNPRHPLLMKPNNAELMQMKIYLTGLHEFERLYENKGRDLAAFLKAAEELAREAKKKKIDPFVHLKETIK